MRRPAFRGVEVWFDQEGGLEHGDEWDAKIRRQIRECIFFIPLISATTQARIEGYFRIEWDLAAERAQGIAHGVPFILPITIDGTHEADALVPDRFRKVQWTHLPDGVVTPDVRMRLLKLWSQRTGTVLPDAVRPASAGGPAHRPQPTIPNRPREPVVAPTTLPPRPGFRPPASTLPERNELGAPKPTSRFGSLELGGARAEPIKREIVKDEAYYVNEANELYFRGRYDLALRSYSKILEYNAANVDAWTAQVRMLVELEELREGRLWAEKALERFPNHPELLAAKAVVYSRTADLDSALAFSDAAIEERGNTPYVWLARGDVLLARGEDRASYCFDQALTLARSDWVHCWQASRIHSFHRNFAVAVRHGQTATELAPDRAVTWLQVGQCQIALGLAARASASLAQARQLDPECPGLATALTEANRISAGGSLLRRIKGIFS